MRILQGSEGRSVLEEAACDLVEEGGTTPPVVTRASSDGLTPKAGCRILFF